MDEVLRIPEKLRGSEHSENSPLNESQREGKNQTTQSRLRSLHFIDSVPHRRNIMVCLETKDYSAMWRHGGEAKWKRKRSKEQENVMKAVKDFMVKEYHDDSILRKAEKH